MQREKTGLPVGSLEGVVEKFSAWQFEVPGFVLKDPGAETAVSVFGRWFAQRWCFRWHVMRRPWFARRRIDVNDGAGL